MPPPPVPGFPPFLGKIFHPRPLQPFLKNFIPPFMKEGGGGGFRLCLIKHFLSSIYLFICPNIFNSLISLLNSVSVTSVKKLETKDTIIPYLLKLYNKSSHFILLSLSTCFSTCSLAK